MTPGASLDMVRPASEQFKIKTLYWWLSCTIAAESLNNFDYSNQNGTTNGLSTTTPKGVKRLMTPYWNLSEPCERLHPISLTNSIQLSRIAQRSELGEHF